MHDEHRRDQHIKTGFGLLVVTDSRTEKTDESGRIARELLAAAGHTVHAYDIVPNDADAILGAVRRYIQDPRIRVVVTSGGTGVGRKDLTAQTIEAIFERHLPGFGELFRRLSYEEIGLAGIYSRATAGLVGNTVVYCLPGSKNAMRTALTRIILPSIGHLLWEVDR